RFVKEFHNAHRRSRHPLRWLEVERITGSNRHRKHPEWDHQRKMKWRVAYAYAELMASGRCVYADPDMLDGLAHHHAGDARSELHALEPTLERASRLFARFPVLFRDQRSQLVGMFLHQLVNVEEHAAAIENRRSRPGGKRGLCRSNRGGDFLTVRKRNLGYG